MNMLVTNDDGVYSPGIAALAQVAAKFGEVRIVAPDVERSSAGQSITWTNADPIAHTTTSDTKQWDSGALSPNATFSTTFSQPGTYPYHCTIHPSMVGTINGATATSPDPGAGYQVRDIN